ncbi:hypothetical protein T484DRAFT_3631965, partial [Baffinella frigidus]
TSRARRAESFPAPAGFPPPLPTGPAPGGVFGLPDISPPSLRNLQPATPAASPSCPPTPRLVPPGNLWSPHRLPQPARFPRPTVKHSGFPLVRSCSTNVLCNSRIRKTRSTHARPQSPRRAPPKPSPLPRTYLFVPAALRSPSRVSLARHPGPEAGCSAKPEADVIGCHGWQGDLRAASGAALPAGAAGAAARCGCGRGRGAGGEYTREKTLDSPKSWRLDLGWSLFLCCTLRRRAAASWSHAAAGCSLPIRAAHGGGLPRGRVARLSATLV